MRGSYVVWIVVALLSASVAGAEPVAYPMKGQSSDQQNRDEYECHQSAQKETGVDPVALAEQTAAASSSGSKSGLGSGASGAALGAARGAADGDAGAGALHGVGMGRLIAVVRSRRQMEKQQDAAASQNADVRAQLAKYDQSYTTCLTGRGYSVK
jgi:hypothetical protein